MHLGFAKLLACINANYENCGDCIVGSSPAIAHLCVWACVCHVCLIICGAEGASHEVSGGFAVVSIQRPPCNLDLQLGRSLDKSVQDSGVILGSTSSWVFAVVDLNFNREGRRMCKFYDKFVHTLCR